LIFPRSAISPGGRQRPRPRALEEFPAEIEEGRSLISGELDPDTRQRWLLSIQVATAQHPGAGSKRLFKESVALADSDIPVEDLAREAPPEPVRPPKFTSEPTAFADNLGQATQRHVEEERRRRILLGEG
jgi:hypothetical protein